MSVIPTDKGERRHIHVYKTRTKNKSNCSAKIWIEKDGNPASTVLDVRKLNKYANL